MGVACSTGLLSLALDSTNSATFSCSTSGSDGCNSVTSLASGGVPTAVSVVICASTFSVSTIAGAGSNCSVLVSATS